MAGRAIMCELQPPSLAVDTELATDARVRPPEALIVTVLMLVRVSLSW